MEEEVFSSGSGLGSEMPWYWIIETLSRSHLDGLTPLLFELVSKAPQSNSDSAKKAREALALRCLDELSRGCSGSSNDGIPHGAGSKGFDLSESCDDVLLRILDENSVHDLQKDISNELKWDVCSFVERKKASMPRSTLESLKNAIVGGTNPLAASLKEISGIGLRDKCVSGVPSGGTGPTTSQTPNGKSLHSEKDASAFCDDTYDRNIDVTSRDMNNHGMFRKKRKLDNQSEKQHSVPFGSNGEQSNAVREQERQSPKANGKFPTENISSVEKLNVDDHHLPHTLPQNNVRENVDSMEKVNVDDPDQPHKLPDNNDLPGEIDLQTKLSFFSSQRSFGEDSLTLADSEINLCMKCNKSGQLLICSSSSCPLAFHESCLGCSATFDDQGSFVCPFCAYSQAISEYVKAKKKASLARQELSLFIGGGNDCKRAKKDDEVDHQGQDEDAGKTGEPENHAKEVTQVASPRKLRSSKGTKPKP